MQNVLVDRAPVRLRRPARLLRLASDERLVAFVRDGDEGAFETLYDRHHPAILGFCRHMLGTREEAEDAVQHTFLAAFRDLAGSDKQIELRPWLFAIARNRCLSLLRARRTHVTIELAEPATDGLAATVERREDLRELLGDLALLPDDQRAALLLAELGALDHAGIATVLGCPREKVKALVFQARSSLAASREARATPCDEIRLELASASGAALRRGPLRRHLRTCDGCRAFKTEVAMQRKLLAVALPVVPTIALKASVFGGSSASAASGGGAAAAMTAGTSGASGGVFATVGSMSVGKVAVSLAVAGAIAGGGALGERLERRHAPAYAAPGMTSAPAAHAVPSAGSHHDRLAPALGIPASPFARGRAERGTGSAPTGVPAPRLPHVAPPPAPASHAADDARRQALSPTPQPIAPSTQGRVEGGVVTPGRDGTPPDQTRTKHRQDGTTPGRTGSQRGSGQGGSKHGHSGGHPANGSGQHGHGSTPPGQAQTPPGQVRTPPGQVRTPPGQSNQPPGSGVATPSAGAIPPGQTTPPPGQSGARPGQTTPSAWQGTAPGHSGEAPGHADAAPGNSGAAPGHADIAPGNSGAVPGHIR